MILLTILIMSSLKRFVQQVIPFTISSDRNGQAIFVSKVILFSCLIIILICIKNPSLFDLCINISNKVILVFSCIPFCVFIAFMCSLCSTPMVLICILMCICRILIKITYLLVTTLAKHGDIRNVCII